MSALASTTTKQATDYVFRRKVGQIIGWACAILLNWVLIYVDDRLTFGAMLDHTWSLELQVRMGMILVSMLMFAMVISRERIKVPPEALSLYLLLFVAFNSVYLWMQSVGNASLLFANTVAFVLMGFFYQGSRRDWWQIYFPITSLFYLAPAIYRLSLIEQQFGTDFVLLEAQKNPVLAIATVAALLAFALGVVRSRDVGTPVSEEIPADRPVERQPLANAVVTTPSSSYLSRPILQSPVSTDGRGFELELVGREGVLEILKGVCNQKIDQYREEKYALISLHVPKATSEQAAFRCETPDLADILAQLIDEAVESLGKARGIVRVSLDMTARQAFILVEDNGRGLSQEMIEKLKGTIGSFDGQRFPDPRMSVPEISALLRFWGADLEIATRLGVGRRVCLRFPLVPAREIAQPAPYFDRPRELS